jgi:hypothetical protein
MSFLALGHVECKIGPTRDPRSRHLHPDINDGHALRRVVCAVYCVAAAGSGQIEQLLVEAAEAADPVDQMDLENPMA